MITDLWGRFSGSGLKWGMKNKIFWSKIGSGFREPCSTPPPNILGSTPQKLWRPLDNQTWQTNGWPQQNLPNLVFVLTHCSLTSGEVFHSVCQFLLSSVQNVSLIVSTGLSLASCPTSAELFCLPWDSTG